MDAKKREKLERYFKNSRRFLWGLGAGNQDETYKWLEKKGLIFSKGASYTRVGEQLLESPGIEALLRNIIIPGVKEKFNDKALEYLRACWHAGTTPDIALREQYNIESAFPFLEINRQFNYVEGWGEFAGLWFEEIEELQSSPGGGQ